MPETQATVIQERIRSYRSDGLALLLILIAAAGLLWSHLTGSAQFMGNFDRLGYFLSNRLSELDTLQGDGLMPGWDDKLFMGFNTTDLPGARTLLSPMHLVTVFVSRHDFYYWAGVCVAGLAFLTGAAAYLCFRQFGLGWVASLVGSLAYLASTHSMIRLAQADTASLVLIALPTGSLLIAKATFQNLAWRIIWLTSIGAVILCCVTGPLAIYMFGFWGLLAVHQSWQARSIAPLACLSGSMLCAAIIAIPHLWGVTQDLATYVRDGGVGATFEDVYAFFNVRPHEVWRAFDDGIFGRYPAEVAQLGNNLNLSEGFQVYSSTIATFCILIVLLRANGEWLRLFKFKDGVFSLFAWVLVGVTAAILIKPVAEALFVLFFKSKLIHARLSLIGTFAAAALTAWSIDKLIMRDPPGRPRATVIGFSVITALVLWFGVGRLANSSLSPETIDIRQPPKVLVGQLFAAITPGANTWTEEAVSPPVSSAMPPVRMLSARVIAVFAWAAIFGLCLAGLHLTGGRSTWPAYVLVILLPLQTWADAYRRWNGPENKTYPAPFANNNYFIAPADVLKSAHPGFAQQLSSQLESDHFRTIFLAEPGQFYHFVAPHLASYWGIRTVEGYLSGVPTRIAALNWPPGTLGFRTLTHSSAQSAPWDLLGILNVRQAIEVNTALYFDPPENGVLERAAQSVSIIPNPVRVLPREFFAARTLPDIPLEKRVDKISLRAEEAYGSPRVEGMAEERLWNAEGTISARYQGARISVQLSRSDQTRFLVLNELYHPRWFARAGSTSLKVYPVNTVMRGVEVPPGATELEFEFVPYSRFSGWWAFPVTGAVLAAFGPWWLMTRSPIRKMLPAGDRHLIAALASPAVRWMIVGAAATALNFGLLYLFVDVIGIPFIIAPIFSAEIGIVLRFLANDRWVFGHTRPSWRRLGEYHLAIAGGFAIWWLTSNALVFLGVHYLLASLLAIAASIGINAATNFGWIWRRRKVASSPPSPLEYTDRGKTVP